MACSSKHASDLNNKGRRVTLSLALLTALLRVWAREGRHRRLTCGRAWNLQSSRTTSALAAFPRYNTSQN